MDIFRLANRTPTKQNFPKIHRENRRREEGYHPMNPNKKKIQTLLSCLFVACILDRGYAGLALGGGLLILILSGGLPIHPSR